MYNYYIHYIIIVTEAPMALPIDTLLAVIFIKYSVPYIKQLLWHYQLIKLYSMY